MAQLRPRPRQADAVRFALCGAAAVCVLGSAGPAWAATLTRGPILQDVGSDTMTIVFELAEAAGAEVRLGEQTPQQQVVVSAPALHHEVRVTGLSVDTAYHYAIAGHLCSAVA